MTASAPPLANIPIAIEVKETFENL
jgi:hypothetical protein